MPLENPKYPGKTYGPRDLAEAQVDFENARLGAAQIQNKERTEKLLNSAFGNIHRAKSK